MNWQQVTTTFILIVGIFVGVLEGIHLADIQKQKLSSHTRLALEQFARMAVFSVEQMTPQLSGPAKKQLAILAVATLLKAFHLPDLNQEAIGIAIEAAVKLLPKSVAVTDSPPSLPETAKVQDE